jgi:hypothetical protein
MNANQEQIEWLRTHQVTRCPPAPEIGLSFGKNTERDLIANYSMSGKTLDMNEDTSLVPNYVLANRRAKERRQMSAKIEIDLEKVKALHAEGLLDKEIGEKLGSSGATIANRRNLLGLPVVGRGGPRRHNGNGSHPRAKVHQKAAMIKAPQSEILRSAQDDKLGEQNDSAVKIAEANGNGHTRCRVAMFEVEGDQAAVLAAVEAVKAALARAT